MRTTNLLFVLILAASLHAGERPIVVGPEFAVGEALVREWSPNGTVSPMMATDGDSTLVVFDPWAYAGSKALYTQRIDRDGKAAGDARLLAGPGSLSLKGIVWTGDRYLVFFWDYTPNRLFAAFVSANGNPFGTPRELPSMYDIENIATRGDEIVIATRSSLVRLRSDATVIQRISRPYVESRVVATGPRAIGVLDVDKGGITLRKLDRSSLSAPVAVTQRKILGQLARGSDMVWTGSEYVAVWGDCAQYSICTVWMARFDHSGRSLGETREIGDLRTATLERGITLTSLGDNTVFVTMDNGSDDEPRAVGRRFRAGVEVQSDVSVIADAPVAVAANAHGSLLVVNAEMLLAALPANGVFPYRIELQPFVPGVPEEILWTATSTPTHVAIVRRRVNAGRPATWVASVLTHDGALVHELEVEGWLATVASNGRDFYLLWGDSKNRFKLDDVLSLQRLAPGTTPIQVNDAGWFGWHGLARHNDSIIVWWNDDKRSRMHILDDTGLQPASVIRDRDVDNFTPYFVSAGDDLFMMWGNDLWQSQKINTSGQAIGRPDVLPYNAGRPRCAWNGIAVGCTFESRVDEGYMFALRDSAGVFRVTTHETRPHEEGASALPSVRAMRGRYVMLRMTNEGHHVVVFDRDGQIAEQLTFREAGDPFDSGVLVPLDDERAIAFYERNLYTPPFIAAQSVVGRVIKIQRAND